jgi:hypothetical protein
MVKNETELENQLRHVDRVDLLYIYSEMARKEAYSKFFQDNGPHALRQRWGSKLRMGMFQLSDEVPEKKAAAAIFTFTDPLILTCHLPVQRVLTTRFYESADYVYRNYWSAELENWIAHIQQTNNGTWKTKFFIEMSLA